MNTNQAPSVTHAPDDPRREALSVAVGLAVDTSDIPRPFVGLRSPLVGCVGYSGETDAQMRARWAAEEKQEVERKAEEERLWRWKITPIWEIQPNIPHHQRAASAE